MRAVALWAIDAVRPPLRALESERHIGPYDLLGAGKRDINDPIHQIVQIGGFPFARGLFKGRLRAPPCSQGSGTLIRCLHV
jgi:hypothetical protein